MRTLAPWDPFQPSAGAAPRAFVAHANADAISVIDLLTWEPKGTLSAGKEPDGMACSPLRVKEAAQ